MSTTSQPAITPDQLGERVHDLVHDALAGHKVIVVADLLTTAGPRVERLLELEATVLVVALHEGTGGLPDGVTTVVAEGLASDVSSTTDEIKAWQDFVADPPAQVAAAVDEFDPERTAYVVADIPVSVEGYLGRHSWGGRTDRFTELEDKTLSLQMWRAAGIPHADEENVPATWEDAWACHERLDAGAGTVWSADSSAGFSGAADRVLWVRDEAEGRAAFDVLGPVSEQLRIMPFLEGVPCSIHGIVLPDGTAALRPVELVILRQEQPLKFVYAGTSTGWDPSPADRDAMRDVVRRVGDHLRDDHGYRGGFSLDGLMSVDGFYPNEINPRFSRGMTMMNEGLPMVSLDRLNDLVVEGIDLGVTAAALEECIVDAVDHHRNAMVYLASPRLQDPAPQTVRVDRDGDALRRTDDGGIGTLSIQPALQGAMVRLALDDVTPGTYVAPLASAAFTLADELWGTGFGDLEPAPQVR